MAWLDKDGDGGITLAEFTVPMMKVTEKLDDDRFDLAIQKLISAEGEAVEPDPADDLPPKFGSYVSMFPTHSTCQQMGIKVGLHHPPRRKTFV